ncbi:glycosyltransferase family 4 protein [Rhizobium sp. Root1220]|uniref:glycosyltransferase family 4 protein n=1 Tax=Rhizobium sp. Root1220 TaxID=1736432 RepID=UPI0006FDEAB3|nr:glycosyltransferase family 4 protein [Rhizobium sp. Root1220]KQV83880.1 glycosyl transferase [Rhizobium sp. Root1220]
MTRHIVAIGPLPPPLHGYSLATAGMMALLTEDNTTTVQNMSPPVGAGAFRRHATKLLRAIGACARLFRQRKHADKACYVGCEGGLGLVYTLQIVVFARLLAYPVYLHHHSFSYIETPRLLMRLVLVLGGNKLAHIFLCDMMRDRFIDTYDRRIRCKTVSNAAYVQPQSENPPVERTDLVIGMLSNLSREKGLETFVALARHARDEGHPLKAILAGPVRDPSNLAMINVAVADLGGTLEYRGPLYDDAKSAFYRDIDVFIFPTTYSNEAQPMVLFEAKAAGNSVITHDRGCIRKQLDESDLLIPPNGEFVPTAFDWLSAMSAGSALRTRKMMIQRAYRVRHEKARESARLLLD